MQHLCEEVKSGLTGGIISIFNLLLWVGEQLRHLPSPKNVSKENGGWVGGQLGSPSFISPNLGQPTSQAMAIARSPFCTRGHEHSHDS